MSNSLRYKIARLSQHRLPRFVDRDMLMRYHWGLSVGHVYSHSDQLHGEETRDENQCPTQGVEHAMPADRSRDEPSAMEGCSIYGEVIGPDPAHKPIDETPDHANEPAYATADHWVTDVFHDRLALQENSTHGDGGLDSDSLDSDCDSEDHDALEREPLDDMTDSGMHGDIDYEVGDDAFSYD